MSCRHVNSGGYRCSRASLPAHRGYCRQHASLLHLPPPVPAPSQPSRRGGRGGGAGRPVATPAAVTVTVPHSAPEARRRSSSVGRTPTVEQLLGRIDRLRASSPSAESAWSEDSDHETPTLGSSRQYAGSGCTGDSSGAESGPEGLEPVDLLHHAGVYTAEEAALLARDKLVRQQALYIQQFSRLQHLLREGRRRYLHELKLERQAEADAAKERQLAAEAGEENSERTGLSERGSTSDAVPGRSSGRGTPQRSRYDAEEKLRATWRYHRHRGVCAVLRRKSWERRADTPAPPGPRCIHTEGGVRCSERCLPASKYCLKHILNDPNQMLYVPCVGRRNLTLEQRDEEFSKSRRKARRTSTGSRASGANTSRQPVVKSCRTSARACARGVNPAVAAVLAARGRAVSVGRMAASRSRAAAAGRKEAVARAAAPSPRKRGAAARAAPARSTPARPAPTRPAPARSASTRGAPARAAHARAAPARAAAARTSPARAAPARARSVPAKVEKARSSEGSAAVVAAGTSGRGRPFGSADSVTRQSVVKTEKAATVKNEDTGTGSARTFKTVDVHTPKKVPKTEKVAQVTATVKSEDVAVGRVRTFESVDVGIPQRVLEPEKVKKVATNVKREDTAARRPRTFESIDLRTLQSVVESEKAARAAAAVKNKDAAAFAAALGVEKTPSLEKLVRRRKLARMADAIEKRDAAALLAARTSGRKSESSPGKVAVSEEIREESTREVTDDSKKVAVPAAVPQPEGAVRPASASKSEGAATVIAALKSKDAGVVAAALGAKGAAALAVALEPDRTPAESGSRSAVPDGATVRVPSARSQSLESLEVAKALAALKFKDSAALLDSLKPADHATLMAAVRTRDKSVIRSVLRSEGVAPIVADLRAKGLLVPSKSEAANPATTEGRLATTTVVPKDSAACGGVSETRRPGGAAARSATAESGDPRVAVSSDRAAPVAALRSRNAGAVAAALRSRNSAAASAALESGPTATSPGSKAVRARGLALKAKVPAGARTKSAAAKAAAAKLKAAALAARKVKKREHCQEPVLRVFEVDMRCPWHTVYVPGDRHATEGKVGIAGVPKEEVKVPKGEAVEDCEATCFGPANKKIKMELDELMPNIGGIIEEVEMKMETNDEVADDMASVSGSGNHADLSTESTLSATSPRADEDIDDDCRDVDMDMDAGEVMLQPPLGADEADLVAVAQGVAMVGAEEEVAGQQDEDSLTNPPVAVDEVEVS
ncbi:serine/arginine repetitive matrix protein 2-like isoform X1 [Schistocerca piceifrons]|uniref:serine/arginine repetitive matrix protein 2-like isoform X1 n=2 Tax=Schistocerca piceifrons TaxID=274613 RepID=UPI001F5E6A39|nr:serine/arginine repetitive matrix protein 2-like isoform X1 [Schistocerca piceifrons]XP_047101120.1 serine/arginine repetitive matrix protein 2-like isoform X1 [Schistocerca piceifrons]